MNPIIKLIANALPGDKKYILFAGAGVSKDAGIPTTWDLMLKTAGLLYVADNLIKKSIQKGNKNVKRISYNNNAISAYSKRIKYK